ncbi:hypothetical protein AB3X94_04095 [Paraburkholderia sp. BR10923]|uniref:Uncharacterized protein n=1 Tax=Paraburkholderia youngii TaxID=2782701 RepID=A0A7Y6JYW8_9BURK|nr:hypothetical protein [Paraburkholderia youngii]NUY00413.1 hypothetical protein [Paraburkholderia youngii]
MNEHGIGFIPAERLISRQIPCDRNGRVRPDKSDWYATNTGRDYSMRAAKTCIEPSLREIQPSIQHLRKRAAR